MMSTGRSDDIARRSSPRPRRGLLLSAGVAAMGALTFGCRSPSRANIELRKENQQLKAQIEKLDRINVGRTAPVIATTGPVINPSEREYGHLFTVHGLKLGSIFVSHDLDYTNPPIEGFKVHLQPTDQDGDIIKASGTITVDAFDLQIKGDRSQRVGHWVFPLSEAANNWYGSRLVYSYVLRCPWPEGWQPAHSPLTIRVTFVDELTRRKFSAQSTVNVPVTPRPARTPVTAPVTMPVTAPATMPANANVARSQP